MTITIMTDTVTVMMLVVVMAMVIVTIAEHGVRTGGSGVVIAMLVT